MGAIPVPQSLTAAQLVSSHELTFTVPTDRRAFARESTTDLGPSGESSTGSRRVSTLDSAPGVLGSAVSEVEQQQIEVPPAHQCVSTACLFPVMRLLAFEWVPFLLHLDSPMLVHDDHLRHGSSTGELAQGLV